MSWILLVALFLATLNPAWGSIVAPGAHTGHGVPITLEVPLCHGMGTVTITLDAADSAGTPATPDDAASERQAGHCVLCLYPSFSPGHDPVMPPVALATASRAFLHDTGLRPRARAWGAPLARAPPFPS